MKKGKTNFIKNNPYLILAVLIFLLLILIVFLGIEEKSTTISEKNKEKPKLNDNKIDSLKTDEKKDSLNNKGQEKELAGEKEGQKPEKNDDKDFIYENPVKDTMTREEKDEIIYNLPDELREKVHKYPETESTMVKYPELKDIETEINISKDLELAKKDPKRKNIPYFNQWDQRWGFKYLQGTFMAESGCGPTALSSVYVGLTGDTSMNPYEMAKFASRNEWYFSSGSSRSLMGYGADALGLTSYFIELTEDEIKSALDRDSLVMLLVHAGDFTNGGHFIILVNYDEEGLIIMDPNSYINTNKKWDFDRILNQTTIGWEISK